MSLRISFFRPRLAVLLLTVSLTLIAFPATKVLAAEPSSVAAAAPDSAAFLSQLATLEGKFFFHQYAQDPVEKRLGRLECMVFGGIQEGSAGERINKLKEAVIERDKTSKALTPKSSKLATPYTPKGSYPAVTRLEKQVLKKIYEDEPLDKRLDRLETKIFGKANSSISYVDRLERLKRTVTAANALQNLPPVAQMPMAPQGQAYRNFPGKTRNYPFAYPQEEGSGNPSIQHFEYHWSFPNNGDSNGSQSGDLAEMHRQMAEMMRNMDRQMGQFMQMGPQDFGFDDMPEGFPRGGQAVPFSQSQPFIQPQPPKANKVKPGLPFQAPIDNSRSNQNKIPAYNDPHAI